MITGYDNVKSVLDYMFSGSAIYMQRKYLEFLGKYKAFDERRSITPDKYSTGYILRAEGQRIGPQLLVDKTDGEKDELVEIAFEYFRKHGYPFANTSYHSNVLEERFSDDMILRSAILSIISSNELLPYEIRQDIDDLDDLDDLDESV